MIVYVIETMLGSGVLLRHLVVVAEVVGVVHSSLRKLPGCYFRCCASCVRS